MYPFQKSGQRRIVQLEFPWRSRCPSPLPRKEPPVNQDGTRTYQIAGMKRDLPYGEPASTIFIVTASYRDPEVASTIARAFIRAAHPERIVVGVHAQNAEGTNEPERDPIAGLEHQKVM